MVHQGVRLDARDRFRNLYSLFQPHSNLGNGRLLTRALSTTNGFGYFDSFESDLLSLAGSRPAALLPESAAPFTAPDAAPAAAPVNTAVTASLALVRMPLDGRFFPAFVLFLLTLRFLVVALRATLFLPEAFAVPFLEARADLIFLLADFLVVTLEALVVDFFGPDFFAAFFVGIDPPI